MATLRRVHAGRRIGCGCVDASAQVILVVKNKVALTHKCVEDYRLADKSVLELIQLKEVGLGRGGALV